jgi:ribulose-5-phosphate 4-epimerase/fuculose-1-phosphate aldolase
MSASEEAALRDGIVEICKRIHARGWLASTDGNVSVRLDDDRILATPTAIHKGFMSADDVIVVDRQGRKLQGTRQPSSELRMHLAAYEERPDVRAVVHAHPTFCIVLSLAGVSLAKCLLPETVLTFGAIPTTAYTTPTTEEVPIEIRKWVRTFDAVVLERHGSLTPTTSSSAWSTWRRLPTAPRCSGRCSRCPASRSRTCRTWPAASGFLSENSSIHPAIPARSARPMRPRSPLRLPPGRT